MTTRILTLAAATAVLGLAGSPAAAQANFSSYVSVGDSLAAGMSSGSLVETHQVLSVPAHVARQAGVADFQLPLISEPGLPPELALHNLLPGPVVAPKSDTPGEPLNLDLQRPYNNLAVPAATVGDAWTDVGTSGGLAQVVLRGLGTQVQQAAGLQPTFVTLWIGNQDVLGAAIRGRAIEGVTLTPKPVFREHYGHVVAALKATGATIVAANLPDVTRIPFVTTIPPVVVNPATLEPVLINGQPVALRGPHGPLAPGTYVTLAASSLLGQGFGIPTALGGNGQPLPDEVILDAGEVAVIRDFVSSNNQAIADLAGAADIPVVDMHALLEELAAGGRNYGGVVINTDYLTGGAISYDGVHPTDLGYAIAANEWIRVINAHGGSLPEVDLAPLMGLRAQSRSSRRLPEFSREAYEQLLALFPEISD